MKIQNTIAFVSGANRGIGAALVRALLGAGASKVYAGARTVESVSLDDPRVVPVRLDVTDAGSVEAAAKLASDTQILFNNAGVLDFGDILEAPIAALQRNLDVNLYGKLRMARAFVPVLEANGQGAVVNVLTLVALASMPGLSVYNASKAAAWSMTQSLRATLMDRGISVHNVFPGAVDTDMLAGVEMAKTSPDDVASEVLQGVAAGQEDIFPDPMSKQLYEAWSADHKAVEKQFATM